MDKTLGYEPRNVDSISARRPKKWINFGKIILRNLKLRVLYKRTNYEIPKDFIPSEVQKDILDNWKPDYNLFSVTQIAERNNKSRGHVQRKVRKLVKMGLVIRHMSLKPNG